MRSSQLFSTLFVAGLLAGVCYAQPTRLNIDRTAGPARVWVSGEVGHDYSVEASTNDFSASGWESLVTLALTNDQQSWFDAASALMPQRFYRAAKLDPVLPDTAADFRLIDHTGVSRHLYYYDGAPSVRAFALIFTGNGCARVRQLISTIKTLKNQFTAQGVTFWMIDSNQQDNRSNIVTEANSLGVTIPILLDQAQLVAHAYRATKTPEVICVSTLDWTIFYRGAIDDRLGSNSVATTQSYLSGALSNFLAGRTVSPVQSRAEGCDITLAPRQDISYSSDIAPLLQAKCIRCHSPGNIAPWAMTNYGIVSAYAPAMRQKVLTGSMPPWHADNYYQSYTNDFSLKPADAARLIQWIDDGAPRGDGPDPLATTPPPTTNYPFAWPSSLGTPDMILTIPAQTIPAAPGDENYHYVTITVSMPSNRWVRAATVKPDKLSIVHHVLVYSAGQSQLSGMDGFFAGYVPGYEAALVPPNTAKLLTNGTRLTFQIHYIRNSQVNIDQTQLGLYFQPNAPTYALQTKSAFNFFFSIPPNNPEYQATATFGPFAKAVYLYELSPHMHLRGSRFKYEAVYPNSSREVLLSVPFYEFSWQTLYRLAQPKLLPAGTQIVCTGAWDNSVQNLSNPNSNVTVSFGEQTDDEMFIGYFNYAEVP